MSNWFTCCPNGQVSWAKVPRLPKVPGVPDPMLHASSSSVVQVSKSRPLVLEPTSCKDPFLGPRTPKVFERSKLQSSTGLGAYFSNIGI